MQRIADIILWTDEDANVLKIVWACRRLEKIYSEKWSSFMGQKLTSIFQGEIDAGEGELCWEKEKFLYLRLKCAGGREAYLLKRADSKEYLYEEALNCIHEGIQIYDENGDVIFLNSCSRKISSIPADEEVEGRNLFDLYNYSREISTVMTSLKIKAPVINRIWSFQTATGKNIRTANSAYPVFKDGELIGSVAFEQDVNIAGRYISEMESIRKSLEETEASGNSSGNFSGYSFNHIIGKGEKLQSAVRLAKKVAPRECTVLLNGETGTGKEIFAQSIHRESSRRKKKFLPINCAAIPDTLIESLLFGTKKGSFTGSVEQAGYFEEANGGTLFLDELNSMSMAMQSKLLRVIQEGTFRRVGGTKDIPFNVRIISSCNENPYTLLEKNLLRKDLFYRLSTITINLPPLREHPEDIEELVYYYIGQNSFTYAKAIRHISPEVVERLISYNWPGNVRELFHVLDYVLNVIDDDTIRPEHLPDFLFTEKKEERKGLPAMQQEYAHQTLQETMDEFEGEVLRLALKEYNYNITQTAQALGIHRQGLQYRIKKYGIII